MAHSDRKYEIVEDLIGGPPNAKPVLSVNGRIIPPSEMLVFNKNLQKLKKVDHYRIRFDIKQFNQSPLRFTPNKDDALWVQKGSATASCPTAPCHDMPGDIWIDDMDSQGEWIDVINMDINKQDFWFTLNLVRKDDPTSTNYVPVDPGGSNQNNGSAGSGTRFDVTAMLAGAALGLIVFEGVRLFLANQ